MELCLGTVQQGMEYGINNKRGKPSREESLRIFHAAVQNGITAFDTARAYGDAELLLGDYFRQYGKPENVRVISKLRPNILGGDEPIYDTVLRECESSLARIGIDELDGYLFHTPEYVRNEEAVNALERIKGQGLARHVGVSIYDISDGDYAIETNVIDYIQLPFSVFDQRGDTSGFFARAKAAGVTIFTRSAFLQGLFFMNPETLPQKVAHAEPMLERLDAFLAQNGLRAEELLIQFVKMQDAIDYLVFGVDTEEQLMEDISIFRKQKQPDEALLRQLREMFANVPESVIIPSLWSGGRRAE